MRSLLYNALHLTRYSYNDTLLYMCSRKVLLMATVTSTTLFASLIIYMFVIHKNTTAPAKATDSAIISYLPLGDSYTIGESVSEAERWPNQLIKIYKPGGKTLSIVSNPSVTDYTSSDLIHKELPFVKKLNPDFVTVQIGVNDYVQGVELETFQRNLIYIIGQLKQQLKQPANILLVTIPDYAKTPTGATYGDPVLASASIQSFNAVIINTAANTNLPVADIFTTSQLVTRDTTLIAPDGLHPSGKQYAAWTMLIKASLETAKIPS